MQTYENRRKQKSAQLRISTDNEQVREATFTPKVNEKSLALAKGNAPIYERVEEIVSTSKQMIEDLQEAKKKKIEDEEYKPTFKPELKDTGRKRT